MFRKLSLGLLIGPALNYHVHENLRTFLLQIINMVNIMTGPAISLLRFGRDLDYFFSVKLNQYDFYYYCPICLCFSLSCARGRGGEGKGRVVGEEAVSSGVISRR